MARRAPDDPDRTFACPHCGEAVRQHDRACRHCGSDATTGWSEAADHDDATVELPAAMSDAEYAELLASDPEIAARRDRRSEPADVPSDAVLRRRRRALYAIVLALLLAFGGGLAALL
ncbi:MAG: hypothetical protein FJ293_03065 [Planctomycetes bacterium]|nr:hypothetical protein [Planctomycetota bacterium]